MSSHTPGRQGRHAYRQRSHATGLRAYLLEAFQGHTSPVVVMCDECRHPRPAHEVLIIGDSAVCVGCV